MFIDTNIFVAARNKRDVNHRRAVLLLRKALRGGYGILYTSDYVFDEAVTVALIRTRRLEVAVDIGEFILSSKKLKILYVDEEVFRRAWNIFQAFPEKTLSFTDATSIALIEKYGIKYIMSFDKHFDGIVPRIT